MELDVRGDPVHTRALGVSLVWRADGRLDLRGHVHDLRKRGFVPVGGDLHGSGIVHHMRISGVVDPERRSLDALDSEQTNVAFEPSRLTRGESCRDPAPALRALAGTRLDAGFARHVGAGYGGPRGCSHVLTLVQLAGATVAWALDREAERAGAVRPFAAGSRLFSRDLVFDGLEIGRLRLLVAAQLTDLHFADAPEDALPLDRYAADRSLRVRAEVDCERMELVAVQAAESLRTHADERPRWRPWDAALAGLAGLPLRAGVSAELLRRIGPEPARQALLQLLLQLTPAVQQSVGGLASAWDPGRMRALGVVGAGSFPDSCYMWRRDGALQQRRAADARAAAAVPAPEPCTEAVG
jgi:hypothetical protein